jgi:hypothetical protein
MNELSLGEERIRIWEELVGRRRKEEGRRRKQEEEAGRRGGKERELREKSDNLC